MGEIPFTDFLRYGVHGVFRMHRLADSLILTHRLTDGHTRKQNASGPEGFRYCGRIQLFIAYQNFLNEIHREMNKIYAVLKYKTLPSRELSMPHRALILHKFCS